MALHDPNDDLQYQAALDKLTRERAFGIHQAIKAGHPVNTNKMIEALGAYLGDDQALVEIIRAELQGKPAFRELLKDLALGLGQEQAREQLADAPARRAACAAEDRADMARADRAAA